MDFEDIDIENIFSSFDNNQDGVLDLGEFFDMIIPPLTPSREAVVFEAWKKLDFVNRGTVPYSKVRDTFDPSKHPNVGNNRRTEEEQVAEFLETFSMHHSTFNAQKTEQVSMDEFM